MNGRAVHNNAREEALMTVPAKATPEETGGSATPACPLASPLIGRVPGLLSVAAVPAAVFVNPLFFGLAGGLLAVISLLLSPAHCRCLGVVGLVGALAGAALGAYAVR
jgi:hypothetical protein